ncbi:MAG TPA: hypothetical protein VG098_06525, partial [Nitrososphaera sp.]|nr:hypothetical protein [Nitrososphaera sp.]
EPIIQETVFAGKIPFAPLLFVSSELGGYAQEAGIQLKVSAVKVAKSQLEKYGDTVDSSAMLAIEHTKKLELKIGPNYFHDIIDSI